jgi:hypothetical protein
MQLVAPAASREEAAAIVAALERFVRATAPAPAAEQVADGWRRTAILEGVSREEDWDLARPWINT